MQLFELAFKPIEIVNFDDTKLFQHFWEQLSLNYTISWNKNNFTNRLKLSIIVFQIEKEHNGHWLSWVQVVLIISHIFPA